MVLAVPGGTLHFAFYTVRNTVVVPCCNLPESVLPHLIENMFQALWWPWKVVRLAPTDPCFTKTLPQVGLRWKIRVSGGASDLSLQSGEVLLKVGVLMRRRDRRRMGRQARTRLMT